MSRLCSTQKLLKKRDTCLQISVSVRARYLAIKSSFATQSQINEKMLNLRFRDALIKRILPDSSLIRILATVKARFQDIKKKQTKFIINQILIPTSKSHPNLTNSATRIPQCPRVSTAELTRRLTRPPSPLSSHALSILRTNSTWCQSRSTPNKQDMMLLQSKIRSKSLP